MYSPADARHCVAGLLLSLMPLVAEPEPSSAKGPGELVITTGGGTWEAAQKKAYFAPFERETGIKIVLVPDDRAKLLVSVERGKPEADLTNVSGGQMGLWLNHKALEKIDYTYFDQETLAGMAGVLKHEYGVGAVIYAVVMAYNEKEYPP